MIIGIMGEPYFDLDFSQVLYLTDTGRRWDGADVSIRDKVKGRRPNAKSEKYYFRSTLDIIEAAEKGLLPDKIMFTFHPQRWMDNPAAWARELVWQNVKNTIKWGIVQVASLKK